MVDYHVDLQREWNDIADLIGGVGCAMRPGLWSQEVFESCQHPLTSWAILGKSLGMTRFQLHFSNGNNTIYFTTLL